MNLKRYILSLAVGAGLLVPALALADGDRHERRHRDHRHDSHCGHHATPVPPQPPMTSQPTGRYELRTVQKWVDGHYVRDWVPETCVYKGKKRRKVKCTEGYYTDRFVPGHYQNVEEWVWVDYGRPRFGVQVSARF